MIKIEALSLPKTKSVDLKIGHWYLFETKEKTWFIGFYFNSELISHETHYVHADDGDEGINSCSSSKKHEIPEIIWEISETGIAEQGLDDLYIEHPEKMSPGRFYLHLGSSCSNHSIGICDSEKNLIKVCGNTFESFKSQYQPSQLWELP